MKLYCLYERGDNWPQQLLQTKINAGLSVSVSSEVFISQCSLLLYKLSSKSTVAAAWVRSTISWLFLEEKLSPSIQLACVFSCLDKLNTMQKIITYTEVRLESQVQDCSFLMIPV